MRKKIKSKKEAMEKAEGQFKFGAVCIVLGVIFSFISMVDIRFIGLALILFILSIIACIHGRYLDLTVLIKNESIKKRNKASKKSRNRKTIKK